MLLRNALVIFPCAFFEEYFAKDFFFFLVGVIILNIIVARSVEYRIVIMIAIRIPISHFLIYGFSLLLILSA